MEDKEQIEHGDIYEVINSFPAYNDAEWLKGRPLLIEKGEKIEFRYFHPVHFRTIENNYFYCEKKIFLNNCKLFAKILPDVSFKNKANLQEILDLELYNEVK